MHMSVTNTQLCWSLTLQSYHKLIVTEAVIQVVLYDPLNLIVYFRTSGLQRSAGDVLNDIGSMLADLTDELDAMLHMEAKQS